MTLIQVHPGDNLQAAVNAAQLGDVLSLEPGDYEGNVGLSNIAGPGSELVIQSSALDQLPGPGKRVSPADSHAMPRIISPGSGYPALSITAKARNIVLRGIELVPAPGAMVYDLLLLGDGVNQNSADITPHHLTIDQCYIHSLPDLGLKRGVALNSAATDITNSWISGFKVVGQDAQAIAGWNGPGPYKILNNYLEGAGENVIFGGTTSLITGLVPSDILIQGNLFSKPLSWNRNDPSYAGAPWTCKNLFELKSGQRIVVDGNVFENNWVDAQVGAAIVFTPRGGDAGGPWALIKDVTFKNNILRNSAQGFNLLGSDDRANSPTAQMENVQILNNELVNVATRDPLLGSVGGPPRVFQVIPGMNGGTIGLKIDHNTIVKNAGNLVALQGVHTGFVFTNNIADHGEYGVIGFGPGTGEGKTALDGCCPGYVFNGNLIVGANPNLYP
jgi:hypothetical protein